MFHHYAPVWKELGEKNVDLVLYGSLDGRRKSRSMAAQLGVHFVDYETVIETKEKYPALVSNHSMYQHDKRSVNFALGEKQVRFTYALGKAKHNFAPWNNDYDLILCFGPYQAKRLQECCSATVFQMGYPRYDRYFNSPVDNTQVMRKLGLDTNKKTLVWVPTWKELSSIDDFADVISSLSSTYNTVVKPHPLAIVEEAERVNQLTRHSFTKVITEVYDNLELYSIADWVLSDYGGTAFGALYLDKNLMLLNMENADADPLTGADSPDVMLREHIVNIDKDERWKMADLLSDNSVWDRQESQRSSLRQEHFFPSYGCSAKLAATALQNIDSILAMG